MATTGSTGASTGGRAAGGGRTAGGGTSGRGGGRTGGGASTAASSANPTAAAAADGVGSGPHGEIPESEVLMAHLETEIDQTTGSDAGQEALQAKKDELKRLRRSPKARREIDERAQQQRDLGSKG